MKASLRSTRTLPLLALLCLGCLAPAGWVWANSASSVTSDFHDPKRHQFADVTPSAKIVVAKGVTAHVVLTYDNKPVYENTIPGPHRTQIGRMPMVEAAHYNNTIKVTIEVSFNGSRVDTFNWSGKLPIQGQGDVGFHYTCRDLAGVLGTPVEAAMRFSYEATTYPNQPFVGVEIR